MTNLDLGVGFKIDANIATRRTTLLGQPDAGKALALDTPLPTPSGWTTMGEVQVGDRLLDEQGRPCNVVFATGIQMNRICYRVGFSDGSTIVADAEHRWQTKPRVVRVSEQCQALKRRRRGGTASSRQDRPQCVRRQYASIFTTEEIRRTLRYGKPQVLNHAIEACQPFDLPEADLVLEPYVLGIWLGDGSSANACVTTADDEVINELALAGYGAKEVQRKDPTRSTATYYIGAQAKDRKSQSLYHRLNTLGLFKNKHVPPEYLRASVKQRMDLLAGLMDSDGTVPTGSNGCEYTTTSLRLATDVEELVTSLGWVARRRVKMARLYGKDCGLAYTIAFRPTVQVFRLLRKAERLNLDVMHGSRRTRRMIVSVEPMESVPVRCIQVDSASHLYLAGRSSIPTHNTNGLTVIAEGLLKIGIPLTGLDWKGDLWGWRSGADGEAAGGFPVVIFGGDHADVDIEESDGREIGHLVADDDLPSIIDLSAFVTDTARRRFATAFLKAFLQAKRTNRAIHPLLFDEYQEFAPERPYGEGVQLLAATQQVVGLGRKRGIGVLGTSLRAAQLNKSVLELTDLYLFMQVAGKNDLASIVDTVRPRASAEELEALRRGIPRLGKGEVYAYSPAWLRILEKRRFRLRETFDSSRTPEIGDADVPEPKAFAEINAPALAARIVATREARAADDPDTLRAEIAKLRAQLAERSEVSEPIINTVTVEKPVLSEADLAVMRDVVARADAIVDSQRILEASVESVRDSVDRLRESVAPVASALGLQRTFDALMVGVRPGPAAETVVEPAATIAAANAQPARKRRQPAVVAAASVVASSPVSATAPPNGLGGGHMRVLEALALRHPAVSTRVQTAVLAGYSPSGGGFANYLGKLRTLGYITYTESKSIALTDEGAALVRQHLPTRAVTSAELLELWTSRVGSARRVFEVIARAYPRAIARESVAEAAGMSPKGGGFANYLGKLRGLGLIEYESSGFVRASDVLFPGRPRA